MNDLTLIKNQIEELEAYRNKVTVQQLDYPIDINSSNIIYDKSLIFVADAFPLSASSPYDESIEVVAKGKKYLLSSTQYF